MVRDSPYFDCRDGWPPVVSAIRLVGLGEYGDQQPLQPSQGRILKDFRYLQVAGQIVPLNVCSHTFLISYDH